jgi:hypothetical protein
MQKYGMITQQKRDELIQNRRNTVYKAIQLANIIDAARHSDILCSFVLKIKQANNCKIPMAALESYAQEYLTDILSISDLIEFTDLIHTEREAAQLDRMLLEKELGVEYANLAILWLIITILMTSETYIISHCIMPFWLATILILCPTAVAVAIGHDKTSDITQDITFIKTRFDSATEETRLTGLAYNEAELDMLLKPTPLVAIVRHHSIFEEASAPPMPEDMVKRMADNLPQAIPVSFF